MIRGDVADEGADDFVVTHAAMQPAEKQHELHAGGNDRGQDAVPMCGHESSLGVQRLGAAFSSSKQVSTCKSGSKLPHSIESEERPGQSAERRTQAGAERREEPATSTAGGICSRIQEIGGNAQGAAEEIGVDAVEAREPLQRGHLALKRGVGEGELILLRLACFSNSLLARKFVGELAEAGGIARAREAILRGLLQRIEGARERALRLAGDRGFVRGAQAGIIQNALVLRKQKIPDLLLLAEKLLVERVNSGALLIGHLPCLCLCAASHRNTSKLESGKVKLENEFF